MDPDAIALFRELADRSPLEREEHYARHHTPAALRAEVESLLRFDGETADSLQRCVASAAEQIASHDGGVVTSGPLSPLDASGWRCGSYRLLNLVGRGGMGDVYLAERADGEVDQRVAVKLLPQSAGDRFRERFLQERQILATLTHPNIARLLDAGHVEHGPPFLVMEYVDGRPIDEFAARLGVRARIALFLKVCSAVAYLHRNLIVHRDLKPGNILVTADGEPKLLDFGIAKLLDMTTDLTVAGMHLLTPDYASPEQMTGGSLSTTSDVYSLGVLLYRLLTGKRAHEFKDTPPHEIASVVMNREPTQPSRWVSELKGDLDAILLKALRKDPQERYQTVEHFADDLRAFLESRPVRARSGNTWYRARKILRRYWVPVTAAAIVIATLAGGLYVATRERVIAEQRFDQVRELANNVLAMDDRMRGVAGFLKPRMDLAALSQAYLEALSPAAEGDPQLALEIGQAYLRLAQIQGGPLPSNLGLTDDARRNLRAAAALIDSVLTAMPENQEALLASAQIDEGLMRFAESAGEVDAALDHGQRAVDQLDRLLRVSQRVRDPLRPTVDFHNIVANVARLHGNLGYLETATRYARRAREVARSLSSDALVAQASATLAGLLRQSGDLDGAVREIQLARDSLARDTSASGVRRRSTSFNVLMAHAGILGARFNSLERPGEAAVVLQEALIIVDDWATQDPHDVPSRIQIGNAAHDLGGLLRDEDPARALTVYDHAVGRLREITDNMSLLREEAKVLAASSYALRRLNRDGEAGSRIDRALALLEQTNTKFERPNPVDFDPANAAIVVRSALGDHQAAMGQTTLAANVFATLLADVMAGKIEPHRLLSHATTLSSLYVALSTLHARNGDAERAAASAAHRRELWEHWAKQLPNSGFVRKQLAAARASTTNDIVLFGGLRR